MDFEILLCLVKNEMKCNEISNNCFIYKQESNTHAHAAVVSQHARAVCAHGSYDNSKTCSCTLNAHNLSALYAVGE